MFLDDTALEAIGVDLAARGDSFLPRFVRHDHGRGRPGPRGERWRLSPQSVWGVVKKYGALAILGSRGHHAPPPAPQGTRAVEPGGDAK